MVWYDGNNPVSFYFSESCDPVVTVAADMFATDMEAVTGKIARRENRDRALIRIYQLDASSDTDIK